VSLSGLGADSTAFITPNFKFEFCNYTSLFIMCQWCYVPNNYCQIYWKGRSWAP